MSTEATEVRKMNGSQKPRRTFTPAEERRVVLYYRKHKPSDTERYFKIHSSVLYRILRDAGEPLRRASNRTHDKPPRADSSVTRGGSKGSIKGAPRGPYKGSRASRTGAARDALTYLGHARERLVRAAIAGETGAAATLGLVGLAIEALGGE